MSQGILSVRVVLLVCRLMMMLMVLVFMGSVVRKDGQGRVLLSFLQHKQQRVTSLKRNSNQGLQRRR